MTDIETLKVRVRDGHATREEEQEYAVYCKARDSSNLYLAWRFIRYWSFAVLMAVPVNALSYFVGGNEGPILSFVPATIVGIIIWVFLTLLPRKSASSSQAKRPVAGTNGSRSSSSSSSSESSWWAFGGDSGSSWASGDSSCDCGSDGGGGDGGGGGGD